MNDIKIRFATIVDTPLILKFIRGIADYEKLSHEVVTTEEILKASLFDDPRHPEVIIGEVGGKPVAFAIFFHNFSSFLGKKGLYLEDLFVWPEFRGAGYGKKMLVYLIELAKERNCGRMEWSVLDWNTPAIQFYESLGAKPMDGWTVYRLAESVINKIAEESQGNKNV